MRQEWKYIDKSEWPERGQWDNEPDKVQWIDEATGLPCLIVRGPMGALCGYVGVTVGHPMFEREYGAPDVSVHGGLTFSSKCQEGGEGPGFVCHIPEPGQPADVWWFGFDCAHSQDLVPSYETLMIFPYSFYRNLQYVENECASLAEQLAAIQ